MEAAARERAKLENEVEHSGYLGLGFDHRDEEPQWCERQRARLAAHDGKRFAGGRIGTVRCGPESGVVVHRCGGGMTRGGETLAIYPGDCIEHRGGPGPSLLMSTGIDSHWFADQQYVTFGMQPARVCFPGVLPREPGQGDSSFGSLFSGAIRSVFFGPGSRRAMMLGRGRMARFRGTDAILARDAESGALDIRVREDAVELYDHEHGTQQRIDAGQRLVIDGNGVTSTMSLGNDGWSTALDEYGLEITGVDRGPPSELPRSACAAAIGHWRWWNGVEVTIDEEGRRTAADGAGGPWRCEFGRAGIFAVVAAEDGSWADSLQATDDGAALHGRNLMGGVVGASRLDP